MLLCMNAAVDQQEMTSTVDHDTAMFMNSSMNESPYFVHEPSSSSNMQKSAKVSHTMSIMLLSNMCLPFDIPC